MICSNGLCDCVKTPLSGKETKSVVRRPTLAMGTLLGTPSRPPSTPYDHCSALTQAPAHTSARAFCAGREVTLYCSSWTLSQCQFTTCFVLLGFLHPWSLGKRQALPCDKDCPGIILNSLALVCLWPKMQQRHFPALPSVLPSSPLGVHNRQMTSVAF